MDRHIHIVPAIMPKNAEELQSRAQATSAYASRVHLDVGDGVFVPTVSWPFSEDNSYLEDIMLPPEIAEWEVHLMTTDAQMLGLHFIAAGAFRVKGHLEAMRDTAAAATMMRTWKEAGAEAGLAVRLETPLEEIEKVIAEGSVDVLHFMSIAEIGSSGHPFDERVIARIETMHTRYPSLMLSVDGGVSLENVRTLVRAGISECVVGAALAQSNDPASTYQQLREAAESAIQ